MITYGMIKTLRALRATVAEWVLVILLTGLSDAALVTAIILWFTR
jgi:hypothetical protein